MRRWSSNWASLSWPMIWGAASLAVAVLIVVQVHVSSLAEPGAPPTPARIADARLLPPLTPMPQVSASDETTSRPLFVPSRRPSPPAPVDAAPAFKRGQFALQGTIVAGDGSYAFLRELSSGKVRRLAKGEKIADLTLAEVAPASATLTLGQDSETLVLQVAKGPPPPAAPPRGATTAPPPASPAPGGSPPAAAESQGAAPTSRRFSARSRAGSPQPNAPASTQSPRTPNSAGSDSAPPSGEITFAEIARRRARDRSIQSK